MADPKIEPQLPKITIRQSDAESQHEDPVENLVAKEEHCNLRAPNFNLWKDHVLISSHYLFGNGYTLELHVRRGCIRTEVDRFERFSFQINVFGLVGIMFRREVENRFSVGRFDRHVATFVRISMAKLYEIKFGTEISSHYDKGKIRETKEANAGAQIIENQLIPHLAVEWNKKKVSEHGREPKGVDKSCHSHEGKKISESETSLKFTAHTSIGADINYTKSVSRNNHTSGSEHLMLDAPPSTTHGLPSSEMDEGEKGPTATELDLEKQPVVPEAAPNSKTEESSEEAKPLKHFVVIGIFSPVTGIPKEKLVVLSKPKLLFRSIWWAIIKLRGIEGLVSLKGVKGFSIYKCDPFTPQHSRQKLNASGDQIMAQLFQAYCSWDIRTEEATQWMTWIHEELNHHYYSPKYDENYDPEQHKMLSIEIKLGWSIARISVVVLSPLLLSLVIGLWLNSKNWSDNTSIQTAWGVASYVVTAGGILSAVLGFISNISS